MLSQKLVIGFHTIDDCEESPSQIRNIKARSTVFSYNAVVVLNLDMHLPVSQWQPCGLGKP